MTFTPKADAQAAREASKKAKLKADELMRDKAEAFDWLDGKDFSFNWRTKFFTLKYYWGGKWNRVTGFSLTDCVKQAMEAEQ